MRSPRPRRPSKPTATPTATATPATTTEGPSEKEWRAKVIAVCKRNEGASRKIAEGAHAEGLRGRALLKAILRRSVPVQNRLLDRLEAIEAPAPISEDYNYFVQRLRQAVPLLEQLAASLGDREALAALRRNFEDATADTRPFATEHGLKACLPDQS